MKNKNKLNRLSRGYFKIPTKIFEMDLSSESVSVYCFLASCAEEFEPSVRYLSERLHMGHKSVARAMAQLKAKNIIVYEPSRRGFRGRCAFVSPTEWVFAGNLDL